MIIDIFLHFHYNWILIFVILCVTLCVFIRSFWEYFWFYIRRQTIFYYILFNLIYGVFFNFIAIKDSILQENEFIIGINISLYIIGGSLVFIWYWKSIALFLKYKKFKNKKIKIRKNDDLYFEHNEKWDDLIQNDILSHNENNNIAYLLDSPQGSGKTSFINKLKNDIIKKYLKKNVKKDESSRFEKGFLIIEIFTADFNQEDKALFLIIKKIMNSCSISYQNYIELENLIWNGSLTIFNNKLKQDPNENIQKILDVFEKRVKWERDVYVIVDELDRINQSYLFDFMTFCDDIFRVRKNKDSNIKVLYLFDIEGTKKLIKPELREYPQFSKYFEKFWDKRFDIKFYFHNIFEKLKIEKTKFIDEIKKQKLLYKKEYKNIKKMIKDFDNNFIKINLNSDVLLDKILNIRGIRKKLELNINKIFKNPTLTYTFDYRKDKFLNYYLVFIIELFLDIFKNNNQNHLYKLGRIQRSGSIKLDNENRKEEKDCANFKLIYFILSIFKLNFSDKINDISPRFLYVSLKKRNINIHSWMEFTLHKKTKEFLNNKNHSHYFLIKNNLLSLVLEDLLDNSLKKYQRILKKNHDERNDFFNETKNDDFYKDIGFILSHLKIQLYYEKDFYQKNDFISKLKIWITNSIIKELEIEKNKNSFNYSNNNKEINNNILDFFSELYLKRFSKLYEKSNNEDYVQYLINKLTQNIQKRNRNLFNFWENEGKILKKIKTIKFERESFQKIINIIFEYYKNKIKSEKEKNNFDDYSKRNNDNFLKIFQNYFQEDNKHKSIHFFLFIFIREIRKTYVTVEFQ